MKNILDYTVLLPSTHPPVYDFAVEELNNVMKLAGLAPLKASTTETAPFISLGETQVMHERELMHHDNGGGGYTIRTVGDNVFIYATTPSGVLNGVYRFCEIVFGYRFYAMDEIVVEKKDKYLVGEINEIGKPDFLGRKLDSFALYRDPIYSARLRQNGSATESEDPYYNGEGTLWASLHDQSLTYQLIDFDKYCTDEYKKKGWWCEDYAEGWRGQQLCWTTAAEDGELYEIIKNNLLQVVKNEPTKTFYMIGQKDNYDYCTCPKCQAAYAKYGVSGVFLRLVNKLADEVKAYIDLYQGGREHYLCMFAYQQTSDPPVKMDGNKIVPLDESCIARDNVMIRFAPVESNVLDSHLNPVSNPISTMSLIGWRVVAKKFAIWDYGTDFHAYYVPFPDWDVLGDNMRLWVEMGAVDILTQLPAHTIGTEFNAMKLFVRSQLTWEVKQDEHKLMDEFIDAYYGSAADGIREYIDYLRKHYNKIHKDNGYTGHIFVDYNNGYYFSLSVLKGCERILQKARKKVTETGERREKILERIDRETLFYRMNMLENYSGEFSVAQLKRMYAELEPLVEKFKTIAWRNGWKNGGGKMVDWLRVRRNRIADIENAVNLSNASNNPLKGGGYYAAWEDDNE